MSPNGGHRSPSRRLRAPFAARLGARPRLRQKAAQAERVPRATNLMSIGFGAPDGGHRRKRPLDGLSACRRARPAVCACAPLRCAAAPRRKGGEDPADCVGSGNGGWGSKGGAASPCQTAMCSTLRRLAYDRYRPHASMTSRRRSSKSVLLYAASTLFPTTWASALSATSRGTPVSEHQSRNELRNP